MTKTITVLDEVAAERARQDAKWGEQNHPDGTAGDWETSRGQHAGWASEEADAATRRTDEAAQRGDCTWALILAEEVAEAFAEDDPAKLRAELVQVAAVATQWIEAIDRRPRIPCDACGCEVDRVDLRTVNDGEKWCDECMRDAEPAEPAEAV